MEKSDYLGIDFTVLDQIENSNDTNGYLSNVSEAVTWKALDHDPDLDPDLCRFWNGIGEVMHIYIRSLTLVAMVLKLLHNGHT